MPLCPFKLYVCIGVVKTATNVYERKGEKNAVNYCLNNELPLLCSIDVTWLFPPIPIPFAFPFPPDPDTDLSLFLFFFFAPYR